MRIKFIEFIKYGHIGAFWEIDYTKRAQEERNMQEEFEIIADDGQIAKMNEEFKIRGVCGKKCESHFFEYPLPVYMTDVCSKFCDMASVAIKIITSLDTAYVSRNRKFIDFIVDCLNKNRVEIGCLANIAREFQPNVVKMPIKQSMYKLLELLNSMSVLLGDLCVYVKSVQMQETVQRHMLAASVLHGLCI